MPQLGFSELSFEKGCGLGFILLSGSDRQSACCCCTGRAPFPPEGRTALYQLFHTHVRMHLTATLALLVEALSSLLSQVNGTEISAGVTTGTWWGRGHCSPLYLPPSVVCGGSHPAGIRRCGGTLASHSSPPASSASLVQNKTNQNPIICDVF